MKNRPSRISGGRTQPPSPLAGEGGPKGRMRGGGTVSRRRRRLPGRASANPDGRLARRPPHPAASRSVFPREGGRRRKERPSPLAGEGGPKGRMRGGESKRRRRPRLPGRASVNSDGRLARRPPHLTASRSVFPREGGRRRKERPSPLAGEGGPKGRMRGGRVKTPSTSKASRTGFRESRRPSGASSPLYVRRTRVTVLKPGVFLGKSIANHPGRKHSRSSDRFAVCLPPRGGKTRSGSQNP